MATLQLPLVYIGKIKIDPINPSYLILDCDMDNRGYEDTLAQICEQMGDEAFLDYVKRMISD